MGQIILLRTRASVTYSSVRGRGIRMWAAMVPLDRALLSSYRLSIVTVPLTVTDWPQFAMQILTGVPIPNDPQISPSRGETGAPV